MYNNNLYANNIYQNGYNTATMLQQSGQGTNGKLQDSHNPQLNRPTSAGTTRSRNGNFSYSRHNTGSSNLNNAGLLGQSYGSSTQNQRPSSAGHTRNSTRKDDGNAQSNSHQSNSQPISHILSAHQIPNIAQGGYNSAQQQYQQNSRPKSAGSIRRSHLPDGGPQQLPSSGYSNIPGPSPQQIYQGQDFTSGNNTTPVSVAVTPRLNHFNMASNAASSAQPSMGTVRPLSANATAHTAKSSSYQLVGGTEHWSAAYTSKATPSNGYNIATAAAQNTATAAHAQVADARPQTAASTVANKLRSAVKLDVAVNNVPSDANPPVAIGEDNDDFEQGLDAEEVRKDVIDGAEDDEMDGKPVDISRSHPEVSLTTASASLELGHLGASQGFDVRGQSVDSYAESQILVGLSTVPNQFCTKHDALELKKLLLLSAGTRGGIVPSSSAVMDMYMVGKVVGVGSYGKVRAAWHRLTSSKVAIKTYDKAKLKDPAHWKRVHSEIKIMEQISHPRIARMYEAVETPKRMHLIMECLDGGNLCSYVKAKRRLTEEESRRIFFQILQAIEYLHGLGVSHRDVKLENVLFANDRDIKLIDFGFSTVCQPGKRLKVFCGTPSYMAPEIVRRAEYEGKPVDMWSMGILLYALLCGCFPFRAKAYPDLYRRIVRGTFPMPEELSAPVKDLLKQLLNIDSATRISAHSALRHSWLQVQLINAPNMDKIRLETTILISDKPTDDLDDEVISELDKFGMSKEEVVRLVLTKTHCSLATLYYLLLDTLIIRRKATQRINLASGNPQQTAGYLSNATLSAGARPHTAGSYRKYSGNGTNTAQTSTAINMHAQLQQQVTLGPAPEQELYAQQKLSEQMATQMQQQQAIDRQEYRLRPKSATQTRTSARPLSAFAGRR